MKYSTVIRCNCKSQVTTNSTWDCIAKCRSWISAPPDQSFHNISRSKVLTSWHQGQSMHRGVLLSSDPPKRFSTEHAHRYCFWSTEVWELSWASSAAFIDWWCGVCSLQKRMKVKEHLKQLPYKGLHWKTSASCFPPLSCNDPSPCHSSQSLWTGASAHGVVLGTSLSDSSRQTEQRWMLLYKLIQYFPSALPINLRERGSW